jgi:hypothetical protein
MQGLTFLAPFSWQPDKSAVSALGLALIEADPNIFRRHMKAN